MKTVLISISIILLLGSVVAQSKDEQTVFTYHENEASHCFEYQVKMLYSATTVGDDQQDSYLKAADAYSQLDILGQECK